MEKVKASKTNVAMSVDDDEVEKREKSGHVEEETKEEAKHKG